MSGIRNAPGGSQHAIRERLANERRQQVYQCAQERVTGRACIFERARGKIVAQGGKVFLQLLERRVRSGE